MINHIQTLLVNENSDMVASDFGTTPRWYTDPSFAPATTKGVLSEMLDILLPPSRASEAERRLDFYLRCVSAPEFSRYLGMFDRRVTWVGKPPDSIAGFYAGLSKDGIDVVSEVLSSPRVPDLFLKTGDSDTDSALSELYEIYGKSREDVKRFTAVLFAVALGLDRLRARRD